MDAHTHALRLKRSPHTPQPAGAWSPGGIGIYIGIADGPRCLEKVRELVTAVFGAHPFAARLEVCVLGSEVRIRCPRELAQAVAPGHDTLRLRDRLSLNMAASDSAPGDQAEIFAAWLLGPQWQLFPSLAEFECALQIRSHVARAAARTMLNFDTEALERPWDLWRYDDMHGFHLREGVSLIDALRCATQPHVSGKRYAFSCYRATEYVLLLGLAEVLQGVNPPLYAQLQALWQRRAIVSAEFHEIFLREIGSQEAPLPPRYYVPGDRVWFRNPDERSADVAGFEGSWVIYLGGGLFSNFWQSEQPFSFDSKCLEIYHWRDGLRLDAQGQASVDEACVAAAVAQTRTDPALTERILARMQHYRDPRGVYAEGGCIDSTREQLRWVCPGTVDLQLPSQ